MVNTAGISPCLNLHEPSGRCSLELKSIWLRHANWDETGSVLANPLLHNEKAGPNEVCDCGDGSIWGDTLRVYMRHTDPDIQS